MSNYNYNNDYHQPSPGPGPGGNGGGREDIVETIAWIVDIGMIFLWFPLGLFLTIMNARGHDFVGSVIRSVMKGGGRGSDARAAARAAYSRSASSRVRADQRVKVDADGPTAHGQAAKPEAKAGGVESPDKGARLREIFGWIIVAVGALATLSAVTSASGVWTLLSYIAIALGGGALIWSARAGKRKAAAFRRCITVSGDRGIVRLKGLAKTLGMTEEELEKQLQEMIDRGYYGPRAYIDHARGLLVIEPEQMRDVYRTEDEAKAKAAEAKSRAARTEYEELIEKIRQADEAIEDEAMSEKIRTMQELTAAIFQEVEAHPEKKTQIQRFMNYYLPTTLKLLDSYARIESQGVSGDNMAKAKADIERIADTLVEGYKKQLDTLYRSEAVDIAGDVGVIENMLRRDGLTGQNDFRINIPAQEPAPQPQASSQTQPPQEGEGQVMGGV